MKMENDFKQIVHKLYEELDLVGMESESEEEEEDIETLDQENEEWEKCTHYNYIS